MDYPNANKKVYPFQRLKENTSLGVCHTLITNGCFMSALWHSAHNIARHLRSVDVQCSECVSQTSLKVQQHTVCWSAIAEFTKIDRFG